ncbi:MAG: dihydrolipoyl dehydrogenase [Pseudomonadota bacterium]
MEKYDVIVIGSGGGTKIAVPAAEFGFKVAFIEKGPMGGTCLNRGCIPSKMLIYPADLIHHIRHAHHVNIEVSQDFKVHFHALTERISKSVETLSNTLMRQFESHPNLHLYRGEAFFTSDKSIRVGREQFTADRIFIAVGSRPLIPPIEGLDQTPYMTSTEALQNKKLPGSMIILGAGYIACELGHAYGTFGTETSLLVRSELLRSMDRAVRAEFRRVYGLHHKIHEGVVPIRIHYNHGLFRVTLRETATDKISEAESEAFLVAAGVWPETEGLGLENTAITRNGQGFIDVDDRLQTRVDGVYALGDCIGNHLFRHSVNFEGEYLMRTLFEEPQDVPIDYGPMPYALFAVPEIAGLGKTEDELEEEGVDYVSGVSTYADSNMGMARQLDYGFAKILVDRQGRKILGAHIIGEEASVMIHMLISLMTMKGGLDDLLKMIFIHPALPEIIRDAARDASGKLT